MLLLGRGDYRFPMTKGNLLRDIQSAFYTWFRPFAVFRVFPAFSNTNHIDITIHTRLMSKEQCCRFTCDLILLFASGMFKQTCSFLRTLKYMHLLIISICSEIITTVRWLNLFHSPLCSAYFWFCKLSLNSAKLITWWFWIKQVRNSACKNSFRRAASFKTILSSQTLYITQIILHAENHCLPFNYFIAEAVYWGPNLLIKY